MPTTLRLRILEIAAGVLLALTLIFAWRADRRDQAKLSADLATAKQSLAQADARQHDRDNQLQQTLAVLAAKKQQVTTPAQIIRELPQLIPLPAPITLQSPTVSSEPVTTNCSSASVSGPQGLAAARRCLSAAGKVQDPQPILLPTADLKPLYDFTLDCKACQTKLAAAQADLTDERAKTAVLTHERNEAVQVAKGGSLLRRLARNAKWLAVGAVAGAIAAKARP
jgi:hypothetical protein